MERFKADFYQDYGLDSEYLFKDREFTSFQQAKSWLQNAGYNWNETDDQNHSYWDNGEIWIMLSPING